MESIFYCSTTLTDFVEMIEICQHEQNLHVELTMGSDIILEPTWTTGWDKTDFALSEIWFSSELEIWNELYLDKSN